MRAYFALPSCTYSITLSTEDLERLLKTGHTSAIVYKDIPCRTGRAVVTEDHKGFKTLGSKPIANNLRFYLDEDVADIEGGDWNVQFLTINLEGGRPKKNEEDSNA